MGDRRGAHGIHGTHGKGDERREPDKLSAKHAQPAPDFRGAGVVQFTAIAAIPDAMAPGPKKVRVVSGEFSKKADHGKWFGAKAKNHQRKEYHDPPEAER